MANEKIFKETKNGKIVEHPGIEPLYLASKETKDPEIFTFVEALFWSSGLKDHSEIMVLLLPDSEGLKSYREHAKKHIKTFGDLNEKLKKLEPGEKEIIECLEETAKHAEMVATDLKDLLEKQNQGRIRTLMWPSFLDHLLREAEYFLESVPSTEKGELAFTYEEIIPFWTEIMAEHAMFSAHLLDPEELDAIDQTWEATFKISEDLEAYEKTEETERLELDLRGLIHLKANLLDGVQSAEIASVLTPELVDHMRKEALYFQDLMEKAKPS